jgi:hypothetical protein
MANGCGFGWSRNNTGSLQYLPVGVFAPCTTMLHGATPCYAMLHHAITPCYYTMLLHYAPCTMHHALHDATPCYTMLLHHAITPCYYTMHHAPCTMLHHANPHAERTDPHTLLPTTNYQLPTTTRNTQHAPQPGAPYAPPPASLLHHASRLVGVHYYFYI